MRHRKNINHLGRTASHRKAMLANMANSLILHKKISTTLAKAKALRSFVEPLITKSKDDSTHSRRVVFSYLQNKDSVSELFREISPKIGERAGGYTRILKTGTRLGDNADMCIIELVDYNENFVKTDQDAKKSTRRSRRGTTKKSTSTGETVVEAAKAEVESTIVDDIKDAADASDEAIEDNKKSEESQDEKKEE